MKRLMQKLMKRSQFSAAAALLLIGVATLRLKAEDTIYRPANVILYNQTEEFAARAPSGQVFGSYVNRLNEAAATLWSDHPTAAGQNGLIAAAIRPNGELKLWVEVANKLELEKSALLKEKLSNFGSLQVKGGPIAFAVEFELWGGDPKAQTNQDGIHYPQVWLAAMTAQGKTECTVDELLSIVWKPEPNEHIEETPDKVFVPDGFVLQKLNPLGGWIYRPEGWHYEEEHGPDNYVWTISKEKLKDGYYDTGFRIQIALRAKLRSGLSPREAVKQYVQHKKNTAQIVNERPERKQGFFTRIGVETLEAASEDSDNKDFHVLTSCLWNDEADTIVLVVAGSPTDSWKEYRDTFDTMSNFVLADTSALERDSAETPNDNE